LILRVESQDAFVLRAVPFTESSLIVDMFTRDYGRLNLLAKGARRAKSRQRSALQPFHLISIGWSGKGEVPIVISASVMPGARPLRGEAFYGANHLNELIIRFLHVHDAHPGLFDAYLIAMNEIADSSDLSSVLRIFEKRMLDELGIGLILDTESDRKTPIQHDCSYDYEFGIGPVAIETADSESIRGATLLSLACETIESPQAKAESRKLLDRAFQWHCQNRNLRSREVYRQTLRSPSKSDPTSFGAS